MSFGGLRRLHRRSAAADRRPAGLDETTVPPPDSTSAAPDGGPGAIELRGSIRRADVESVCARAGRVLDAGAPGPVTCRLEQLVDPAMPAIEVLARLALRARRNRRRMRLEHAPPQLLELLALCGLDTIADPGAGPVRDDDLGPLSRGGPVARRGGRSARCRGRT
jgi:hypothetical protein